MGAIDEADYVLELSQRLMAMLSAAPNVEIHTTRSEDIRVTHEERRNIAASVHADLVLSLHVNAELIDKLDYQGNLVSRVKPTLKGLMTFIWPHNMDAFEIGTDIMKATPQELRRKFPRPVQCWSGKEKEWQSHRDGVSANAWLKKSRFICGNYAATTVLVECGFSTYPSDLEYMLTDSGKDAICQAIAIGVKKWRAKRM
jgi:hypothetical protein